MRRKDNIQELDKMIEKIEENKKFFHKSIYIWCRVNWSKYYKYNGHIQYIRGIY